MNQLQWAIALVGGITLVGALWRSKDASDMPWVIGVLITIFVALGMAK